MRLNEKAAPGAGTPESGTGSSCLTASDDPHFDITTLPGWRQAVVAPKLSCGRAAAIPGRELAALLSIEGCDPSREIGALVERERASGIPICATTDATRPGYYLPETAAELAEYRRSLQRRVAAVTKTLRAIEDAHDELTGQQHISREVYQ